jgi:hypothetical protein
MKKNKNMFFFNFRKMFKKFSKKITLILFFCIFFVFGCLIVWNITKTNQLEINLTEKKSIIRQPPILLSNTYYPVIHKVLNSNTVSIRGSTINIAANIPIYQYVGLKKGKNILIDSNITPRSVLPLFNYLLKNVKFNSNIENGDVLIHAYYSTPVINDAINPIASVHYVYYQSCFLNTNGTNACWNGIDFCEYPIVGANQVILYNFQDILKYGRENIDTNIRINPSNGCFYVTVNKDLLNEEYITKLTAPITINAPVVLVSPFTLSIRTQIRSRTLTLCTTSYTITDDFSYIAPKDDFYDISVDYGDGTPLQNYTGIFGVNNPITHTYLISAPATVLLRIYGYLPAWNCLSMSETVSYIPMTRDIVSWGNVSMSLVNFYPESNLRLISAGSPPLTIEGMCFFFPPQTTLNANLINNLNTWNVNNLLYGIKLFSEIRLGSLNLTNWKLPKLQVATMMFVQTSRPIIGNLRDMTFESLQHANYMFAMYSGGPIDLSNANMSSLISAVGMFEQFNSNEFDVSKFYTPKLTTAVAMFRKTLSFPNLNITNWNTDSLEDIRQMFFGCDGIKPVFSNWNLQKITSCEQFIQSTSIPSVLQISSTADYNQILVDFESKTTTLNCNWGLSGFDSALRINGIANTAPGLISRTNLITRGWIIVDLNL